MKICVITFKVGSNLTIHILTTNRIDISRYWKPNTYNLNLNKNKNNKIFIFLNLNHTQCTLAHINILKSWVWAVIFLFILLNPSHVVHCNLRASFVIHFMNSHVPHASLIFNAYLSHIAHARFYFQRVFVINQFSTRICP